MNPILKECLDNIKKRVDLSGNDCIHIAIETGEVMQQVYHGCKTNPNLNFKGGESADENSYVPRERSPYAVELEKSFKVISDDIAAEIKKELDTKPMKKTKT